MYAGLHGKRGGAKEGSHVRLHGKRGGAKEGSHVRRSMYLLCDTLSPGHLPLMDHYLIHHRW